ncbi:Neuroblastoma-amplified sequence [Gryllus bimaculatus]|nr:Neuroblastoma-amplified sequence [Gryllus bimaculatus]
MKQSTGNKNSANAPDECILYELLVYSEWKTDPEFSKLQRNNEAIRFTTPTSSVSNALQYFVKRDTTLDEALRLQLRQMPWQFAVGDNGKVVAVLQDTLLEIRIARDEYSSVVGKAVISRDPFPQWRKLAWSSDCSMLAIAHSNGVISFYDLLGSNIFTIFPSKVAETKSSDVQNPVASIIFHRPRIKSPKWSCELIVVDYHGHLTSYFVSPNEGFQENHTFSFATHYRNGVFAVSSHPSHNLLFVAGSTGRFESKAPEHLGSSAGLSAWRILNDYPFYKLAMSSREEEVLLQSQRSLWNWVPLLKTQSKKSTVFKMQVSPEGKLVACLHTCGSISLWRLPSMEMYSMWELAQQPGYDIRNPQFPGFASRSKTRQGELYADCYPVDINWWSEQAVIVARLSGAVSVCSVSNLRNLLGESPEFLAGQPQVSAMCSERGFLGLECETQISSFKRSNDDLLSRPSETESSDDEDEVSFLNRSSALLQSAVYLVTDMERFQPKRKRPKLLHKTYRLLGLKSTTPEELYARKIDNEEYGDALDLARTYNLDCDLVYQRQWRNSKVSIHTIRDYLSKITKRSWVLKECVQRVPENFEAAQELLEFGLLGTNLETLVAIGEGTDGGNFIVLSPIENETSGSIDEESSAQYRTQREEKLLAKIKSESLTAAQQELILYRWKLLWYLDMLHTYKKIQSGPNGGKSYNFEFYDRFRSESVLASTVEFAREGRWYAVKILLTYHGNAVLRHWLPILSNFPETLNPRDYEALLPECDSQGSVFPWKQQELRPRDWCERDTFRKVWDVYSNDDDKILLEPESELGQFSCDNESLSQELLSEWYKWRAHCIEKRSCMVDHALSLVKLAQARNIIGLEELYGQLLTLESLVYDVHLEDISLQALQKMTDLEKAKLLLSKSTEATFVRDVQNILRPFLVQCEKKTAGSQLQLLRGCLLDIASHHLSLPLLLFEHFRSDFNDSVIKWSDAVTLAFDCLYAYPHADQWDIASKIVQCVGDKNIRPGESNQLSRLQEVENDLQAANILSINDLPKPLSFIRDCKAHPTSVQQLLLRLSRSFARKVPPPTKMQWEELLNDMLTLHAKVFSCISLQTVYEMYAETLLSSGSAGNIRMASDILEVQQTGRSYKRVPFDRSVQLVLQVAREYFDSAGSLTDPAMELAKACLHLIVEEEPSIQENLDLIASLQLLNDFGLSMLPLQVRQCRDRLKLVESCVRKKPLAYRSWHRLLQLAQKLRVSGSDARQREGHVLSIVAETALKEKDLTFCADMCKRIVDNGFPGAWEVVQNFGMCSEFSDLKLRNSLLGFALLHCPPENIEPLIRARCLLESEILHKEINSQVDPSIPGTPQKEFVPSSLAKTVGRSTEALKQTTYNLIHNISSKDFWKNSFSWGGEFNSSELEEENFSPFSCQGLPAFYATVSPECHMSNLDIRYDRFAQPDIQDRSFKMCRYLLRTVLLEQSTSGDLKNNLNPDVLCELSMRLLPEDSALGLCHLLAVGDVARVEEVFRQLPCTSISLQLACYCFALKGWLAIHCGNKERVKDTFLHAPLQLVQYMAGLAAGLQPPPDWAAALLRHHHQLADYVEGQQLQDCGCGVDLQLFSSDSQYRRESILGLALTVKPEQFELAVSLGARHGVSVGEIGSMHVNALLLAPPEELSFSALVERLEDPTLRKRLNSEPGIVCERMTQYVYPSLSGTDHARLIEYYNLLASVAKLFVTNSLPPKEHIKLLKKVKNISTDIDYKDLVSGEKSVLEVLRPVLHHDNVGAVAKLVQGLPDAIQDGTQPSSIYGAWALHCFLQVLGSGEPVDVKKCLKQLDICQEYFSLMEAKDVEAFARGSCFTVSAQEGMDRDCRIQLLNSVREYCQSQSDQATPSNLKAAWKQTADTLTNWEEHLKVINSKKAAELWTCGDETLCSLLKQLERSCGESNLVLSTLQEAVESAVSLRALQQLVQLLPSSFPSLLQLLEKLLSSAAKDLRSTSNSKSLSLLVAVLQRLREFITQFSDQINLVPPTVWRQLEQLCIEGQLTPDIQLEVLSLLQTVQNTVDDGGSQSLGPQRLLLHHTQAAVTLAWPETHPDVNDNDLATDANRRQLFATLLGKTTTWEQLQTLVQLLKRWPPFEPLNGRNYVDGPWLQCVDKLLNFEGIAVEEMEEILEDIFQDNTFSEESLQEVVKKSEGLTELSPLVLTCLLMENSNLHRLGALLIQKYYHLGVAQLTVRVCRLLLQRGLTASVVSSRAYPQLVELLLSGLEETEGKEKEKKLLLPDVTTVCKQLVNAGCLAEAGTLHLRAMGAPSALMDFSTALLVAQRWSSED